MALDDSEIPSEHREIWEFVHAAQTLASAVALKGVLTRTPDEVARSFLEAVGYGPYFTHRLGHGVANSLDITCYATNFLQESGWKCTRSHIFVVEVSTS